MKLFTKDIDKKLFEQYSKGSDLANQKVIAKIFNPYGRGTWYIINSDPEDPDYLWAIVDLFDVETGSVSRSELENILVPPFRLNLERDSSFQPKNALEVYNGLRAGKMYKRGGGIDNENLEMVRSYNNQIAHHTKEMSQAIKGADYVPAWVVSKLTRSASDLSDATHYMDGIHSYDTDEPKMQTGGTADSAMSSDPMIGGTMASSMYANGGNIGDVEIPKSLRKDLEYVLKVAGEKGVEMPELKKLLNGGNNIIEAQQEFSKTVNVAGGGVRVAYGTGSKFHDFVLSYLPNKNQRYFLNKYGEDEIVKNYPRYAKGGGVDEEGIDLFEDYDNIPAKVQKVLDKYSEAFENEDYAGLEKANKALKKIGYTFEYGLDGTAYDLHPIGTKGKSETMGDDETFANGGDIGEEKLYRVKWQQHDEDGNYARKREEDIYAFSKEDAWLQAYNEGEHENDYLISIEELKQYGDGGGIGESNSDKLSRLGIKTTNQFGDIYRDFLDRLEEKEDGEYVGYKLDLKNNQVTLIQEKSIKVVEIKDYSEFPREGTWEVVSHGMLHYAKGGVTSAQKKKVGKVMHEWKAGKLHSGSKKGPVVKSQEQAVAIALSEAGLSKTKKKSGWKHKRGSR